MSELTFEPDSSGGESQKKIPNKAMLETGNTNP
jgi:hypothetical protein